ncbi:MAG: hypothetical protein PQJ58_06955 [Spirochaetales bacterium]|nr:hypothetical protein [Spirochaetales bacterium]
MISNPRFWLALMLFFAAASLSSGIRFGIRKGSFFPLAVHLVFLICSFMGISLFAGSESVAFSDLFNVVNLIFAGCGILAGLRIYLMPLVVLFPLLTSLVFSAPLAPFTVEKDTFMGELYFYPGNENQVKAGWISGGTETFITLEGEKAGVLFVRKERPEHFFFLKNSLYPLAVLSEARPVTDLAKADSSWYFFLTTGEERDSSIYKVSFPAVKFHETGFFSSWSYSLVDENIIITRQ